MPTITNRPPNVTNAIGTTATICVGATGMEPLTYQWRHVWGPGTNYADLPGATNACLELTNIQPWITTNNYRVQICDIEGCVTSTPSTKVWVVEPPYIVQPPTDQALEAGDHYSNRVTVTNLIGALSYQWFFNGDPLPGKTITYNLNPGPAPDRNEMFRNDGGGVFTPMTNAVTSIAASWSDVTWVDHNGDGYLDLFATTAHKSWVAWPNDFFWRNLGNGEFAAWTTNEVGMVLNPQRDTAGPVWCDVDGDGDLDLYVSNFGGVTNFLYRNDAGRLISVKAGSLPAARATFAAVWADFNNDGLFDLFTGGENGTNMLHLNRGKV